MHGSLDGNAKLLDAVLNGLPASDAVDTAVCVPFPYLAQAREKLAGTRVAWGGQNLSQHAQGAYTGEVSAAMLLDFGCRYVIVGHSERRQLLGESDEFINRKVHALVEAGLGVIFCIGETLEERETEQMLAVLRRQVRFGLKGLSTVAMADVVVAYEPVWAIGTGKTASDEQAQEAHAFIRALLKEQFGPEVAEATRILYGGSVKPGNVDGLMTQADVDGALVGGASLKAEEFVRIARFKSS